MYEHRNDAMDYFKERSDKLDRPASSRKCTDIAFLVIMFLVIGPFIGYGAYAINQVYSNVNISLTMGRLISSFSLQSTKLAIGYIFSMVGLALLIALITLITIRYFTFCAYVFILVSAFAGLIALMIISFVYGTLALGVVLGITIVIAFIVWACYRKELLSMVVIMKTVAILLSARPLIFLFTFTSLLYALLTSLFWLASYWSILIFYDIGVISQGGLIGLTVFWVFCLFYLLFLAFYITVFLLGGETALWFYKS